MTPHRVPRPPLWLVSRRHLDRAIDQLLILIGMNFGFHEGTRIGAHEIKIF